MAKVWVPGNQIRLDRKQCSSNGNKEKKIIYENEKKNEMYNKCNKWRTRWVAQNEWLGGMVGC